MFTVVNSVLNFPGKLERSEGGPPSGEVAANEAYDGAGLTFDLFQEQLWSKFDRWRRNAPGVLSPLSAGI